jgi:hypothetical protein
MKKKVVFQVDEELYERIKELVPHHQRSALVNDLMELAIMIIEKGKQK